MDYYPAFICENGHDVCTCDDQCEDRFCQKCGAWVIHCCPHCGEIIPGKMRGDVAGFLFPFYVPKYCASCGKPFPWTANAIEAATYMIQESDLPEDEQQRLIDVLPDMVEKTPRTQLATVRAKKALALGGWLAEGLRSFLVEFGCELLKSKIFP